MRYPDIDDAYQLALEEGPDLRARRQRTARRAKVNEFLKERSYWRLLRFLSVGVPRPVNYMTIGEALQTWRFHLHAGTRIEGSREEVWMKYFVARYFNRLGKDWLL